MEIQTRDFGLIHIEENDIITFVQPIYGFEELKKYVILYDEGIGHHFAWMQSVEDANTCFIMMDPDYLSFRYCPKFTPETIEMLGDEDYICWCIMTLSENFEKSTVNLKSPVLINPVRRIAAQIITDGDDPVRQLIMSTDGEAE